MMEKKRKKSSSLSLTTAGGSIESSHYFGAFFRNGEAGEIFDNSGRRYMSMEAWQKERAGRAATITTRYSEELLPKG